MKIADADISMNSCRTYLERDETHEELRIWGGQPGRPGGAMDMVSLSRQAREKLSAVEPGCDADATGALVNREVTLKRLITEILSGREVRLARMEEIDRASNGAQEDAIGDGRQGWGLEYTFEQSHYEQEQVTFEARGIIQTADGRRIDFGLELAMSREFLEKNSITLRAGDAAIDPLVINFDGNAADLTSMRFSFDLDSDGVDEELAAPVQGRGFLAIDLNGDGIINNGGELFGPSTGNGFTELAAYDDDKNSWIDENDAVYARLSIMSIDPAGARQLYGLQESGVGAICLGNRPTQFDVRPGGSSELAGQIRSTGIYVSESGAVGTIQQLDLVA